MFKSKVLFPLLKRLFRLHQQFPAWLKSQLSDMNTNVRLEFNEFDRYDLRNAFDLVMGKEHSQFKTKELILSLTPNMPKELVDSLLYFNFTERVFQWYFPYLGITNFDEAIKFFFKVNRLVGRLSLSEYGLYNMANRLPSRKLPIQVKLFRDWSLISHKVLATFRKENNCLIKQVISCEEDLYLNIKVKTSEQRILKNIWGHMKCHSNWKNM
jgi:hypothetical protein